MRTFIEDLLEKFVSKRSRRKGWGHIAAKLILKQNFLQAYPKKKMKVTYKIANLKVINKIKGLFLTM